jgi:hypothetical protein
MCFTISISYILQFFVSARTIKRHHHHHQRQVFKPFMKFFFLIFYEVISIINKKKTLFKGFTRGGPWVPSLTKQNLNRTQTYKVIAFQKIKRTF